MNAEQYPDTDAPSAWSDAHILYVVRWLLNDERSPWRHAPSMTFAAMRVTPGVMSHIKKGLRRKTDRLYLRFRTRCALTGNLKKLTMGEIVPVIEKRSKVGWVIRYKLVPAINPQPLPIPQFLRGQVRLGQNGVKLSLAPVPVIKPRGERSRLLNPFGV